MRPVSDSSRPHVRLRRRFVLAVAFLLAPAALAAQQVKPGLDHEDTYRWNSIGGRTISADGAWLAYILTPWDGDPTLVVLRSDGSAERRFRGRSPSFTRDSRHLAFRVPPVKAVVDSLRLEGKRGDDLPGDSLAVVNLAEAFADGAGDDGGVRRAGPIDSFRVPPDGGAFVAYLLSENPEEEEEEQDQVALGQDGVNDSTTLYLREIGRVALLTAKEEVQLAKRMEKAEVSSSRSMCRAAPSPGSRWSPTAWWRTARTWSRRSRASRRTSATTGRHRRLRPGRVGR